MKKNIQELRRYEYQDPAKERAFYCLCGVLAPPEIIEYYRFYHVLGCMRCRTPLAVVDHPRSMEYEFGEPAPLRVGLSFLAA